MSSSLTRFLGCSLGITLLGLGTTAVAQAREDDQFLRLQTPDRDVSVQVSENSIVGSEVRLVRAENAVRGRASGRSVFFRIQQGQVEGLVGGQPARLALLEEEGLFRLKGTLIGSPVGLEIGPERLSGSVGPCVYDLEYEDEAYVGVRFCGVGDRQPVYVFLSPGLPERGSPMLAMALTLLLGM